MTDLLSASEELDLVVKAQKGCERSTERLITAHLPLIEGAIKRTGTDKFSAHYDDLRQVGLIALYSALQRFDTTRGFRFSTYARHDLRKALSRELERTNLVHVPEGVEASFSYASLDAPVGASEPMTFADIVESATAQVDIWTDDSPDIESYLVELTDDERDAFVLRHGVYDGSKRTIKEVAMMLGRSESTVKRLIRSGTDRLQYVLIPIGEAA